MKGDNATEPPLRHHIRHWTARFANSLAFAAIAGMGVNRSFSNIDKYGMIVRLTPRPHSITGSRFSLQSCSIVPMEEFRIIAAAQNSEKILMQHARERELIKEKTAGQQDFIACFVIATNEGRYKLDGNRDFEIRFKPLGINRDLARSPQLLDPTLAWRESLEYQIKYDVPNRTIARPRS